MGKITTEGKATRLVKYDRLNTTVSFHSRSKLTSKTIKTALEDCEKFLKIMTDMGVAQETFEAGNNSSERDRYNENNVVETSRVVVLRSGYDLNLVNVIMHVIEQNSFDADVDFSPELSNEKEIKEELYEEATVASKEKAGRIARSVNMEITGLEKLETDDCYDYSSDEEHCSGIVGDICIDSLERFSSYAKLGAQQTEIEVTVKGVWTTEEAKK